MKYISVGGGLGNQMFAYAFLLKVRSCGYDAKFILTSLNWWEHKAGFELERVFGIKRESRCWEYLYNKFPIPFRKIFHVIYKPFRGKNFEYEPYVIHNMKNYGAFYGTFQSELYFKNIRQDVLNAFKFNESLCNDLTKIIVSKFNGTTPVSVHIRRGDYLSPAFANGFGNCCTIDYYKKAIDRIRAQVENPLFVFFSDDIMWVKENLVVDDAIYVDHNRDEDAWQDMYLMSKCTHNIIANSTFSWWGAWLNCNEGKIVIAPKKWFANKTIEHVVPNDWIRI